MHPTLRLVERFEDLLQRQNDDSPYDYQTMFAADGFFARRASQKKLKLLKRIDEELRGMLWPGERVTFLTTGVLYSFWEAYFLGLPMYYLNRRALIVTTERLILFQVDSRLKPRELRSQLLLRNTKDVRRRFGGAIEVRMASGEAYKVAYVPRRDRRALVDRAMAVRGGATRHSAAKGIEHLCPHCYEVLEGHPVECRHCNGTLKSARKAMLLSLLYPGLGDIYIGHARFAVLEIIVASVIWLNIVVAALAPDPMSVPDPEALLATALVIFLFVHGMDAATTFHVARKGHYPAGERTPRAARSRPAAGAAR